MPEPIEKTHQRRDRIVFLAGMWVLIVGLSLYRAFVLPETDIFWQVKAGQWTLDHGRIPTTALWGWLVQNEPWLPNSWLWNVMLAPAWQLGGITGLGWLHLLLGVIMLALLWRLLVLFGASARLQFLLVCLLFVLILPWLTMRPQEADYIFTLTFMILASTENKFVNRHRPWVLLVGTYLITTLWMNLHLTAPVALGLFTTTYWFISAYKLHEPVRKRLRNIGLILLAVGLGALSTPFGLDGILKAGEVSQASFGIITEWNPIDLTNPIGPIILATIIICGILPVLYLLYKRQWLLAIYIAAVTILGAEIIRFSPYLILVAPLLLLTLHGRKPGLNLHAFSYLAVAGVIFGVGFITAEPVIKDPPASVILSDPRDLNVIPHGGRVLSLPTIGSEIILYRPDLSNTIDGRNDIYGRERYLYLTSTIMYGKPQTAFAWMDREHVDSVVFQYRDPKPRLFKALQQAGWRQYNERDNWVFVRPGVH